ncbi:MAG: hypothetical protein ACRC33_01335 [Gemmataceae bacterium]
MSDDLTREDLYAAVDELIDDTLDDARPPFDALAVARRLGVTVKVPTGTAGRRLQFLAAQAVGAHLKPIVLRRLGIEGRPMLGASVADAVASRLLVPTAWLVPEARASGYDLLALAAVFQTAGPELIAWRLLDLDAPCAITVIDNGRVEKRRANAFRPPRELTSAELACRLAVHRTSRPATVREDGWTAQGWPVHEVDWKREILRAVPDEG